MGTREYTRRERLATFLCLGLVALSVVPRLVAAGTVAWGWFAAGAVATAAGAGPIAWIARERLPAERIATIKLVLGGAALLALPFVLAGFLLWDLGSGMLLTDSAILGTIVGVLAVYLAERRDLPDRVVARVA